MSWKLLSKVGDASQSHGGLPTNETLIKYLLNKSSHKAHTMIAQIVESYLVCPLSLNPPAARNPPSSETLEHKF